MPNGKGLLDCRYCVFAWPLDGAWPVLRFGSPTRCLFHQCELPAPTEPGNHRFCIHIQPSQIFFAENRASMFRPLTAQLARFGAHLEPGVLYEYNAPSADQLPKPVQPLATLRLPDYANMQWTPSPSTVSRSPYPIDPYDGYPRPGTRLRYRKAHRNFFDADIIANADRELRSGEIYTLRTLELAYQWARVTLQETGDTIFALYFFDPVYESSDT